MFYMVIYVTLTILPEHGILSLLRAKLSLLVSFKIINIDVFCFSKSSKINYFTKVNMI